MIVRPRAVQAASLGFLQLRPRLPGVPALLKLRPGLLQRRHAIGARHRTVDGHRPEPAQTVGTAAGLIDAADLPLAGVDGVVRAVLVDPGAEAGRAEFEGYALLLPRLECDDDLFPVCKSFSLTALLGFLDFRRNFALSSEVLPVAIGTRNAVYG